MAMNSLIPFYGLPWYYSTRCVKTEDICQYTINPWAHDSDYKLQFLNLLIWAVMLWFYSHINDRSNQVFFPSTNQISSIATKNTSIIAAEDLKDKISLLSTPRHIELEEYYVSILDNVCLPLLLILPSSLSEIAREIQFVNKKDKPAYFVQLGCGAYKYRHQCRSH